MRSPVVPALAGALLLCAAPLAAQTADSVPVTAPDSAAVAVEVVRDPDASPPLPIDHWAHRAAERAWALGLAPGYFPAQRSAPRAQVARALREAALRAPGEAPALAATAAGWLRRFEEEFPEYAPGARRSPLLGGRAGVVGGHEGGRVEPAWGAYSFRRDPAPLPDRDALSGAGTLALGAGPAAAMVRVEAGSDGVEVPSWDVSAAWGPLALAVGREPVGYGPARGGGITASGASPYPRAQVQTTLPVELPWLLRPLGAATFHTTLTRLPQSRHPGRPWLWTGRVGLQPHARLQIGVNRASIFGGDSITTPVTLGNLTRMFFGLLSRDFENQVISADGRWRLPTERIVPATAYFEWGSEDASGAWWKVPGRTFGLFLPRVAAGWAGGAEYTAFREQCCGNPPWYMHASLTGGWVYDHRPLGHPLGGEGWEALAYAQAELLDARLRVDTRGFVRRRGDVGLSRPERMSNLFVPARAGGSVGGVLDAAWRLGPRLDARVSLYRDAGDGWREQSVRADLSYLF